MPIDALDPTWIDAPAGVGPTYNSEELRRDMGFLLAGGATPDVSRSGVLDTRALTVTLSGSNVQINPGGAAVGTGKGAYLTGASVTATVDTLTPADATNPRRDRVVLEVLDPDNGGGAGRKAQFRVIAGQPDATAASGGGYPPAPTSPSITLAYIDVPKSGNGSPVVTDVRPYTAAAGAPIPVRDVTDRGTVTTFLGREVSRLDAGGLTEVWNGTAWVAVAESILLSPPDSGWTVNGGLVKLRTVAGLTLIQCECRVTRTASGGAFSIGTAFGSLLASFIPVDWRPALVTDGPSILNTAGAAGKGEPIVRIGTDGTMAFRAPFGGAAITGATGDYFTITASWWK